MIIYSLQFVKESRYTLNIPFILYHSLYHWVNVHSSTYFLTSWNIESILNTLSLHYPMRNNEIQPLEKKSDMRIGGLAKKKKKISVGCKWVFAKKKNK